MREESLKMKLKFKKKTRLNRKFPGLFYKSGEFKPLPMASLKNSGRVLNFFVTTVQ